MKLLITGNMGYLGPVVIKHLRSNHPNATLIGFDMGYFGNCITTTDIFPECWADLQYFGDVRHFPTQILNEIDGVIHLAAISNDPMGNMFEDVTLEINHRASVQLAQKAKQAGVKAFVFASSCSMYGAADDSPKTEDAPLNPLTAYAKSKVYTERDLQPLADKNFKITSLRFSTACGMSDRLRLDLVLNDFVAGAVASKKITILSDGTPWRPLIHVKDMARAIEWAVGRDAADGGVFLAVNIGSNEWNYQVKDLAKGVAKVIPGIDVSINKDAQPDKRSYRVNFDLFEKLAPDHQPALNLVNAVAELKNGLEAMNFHDADFRNSQYMRLRILKSFRDLGLLNDKLEWVNKENPKATTAKGKIMRNGPDCRFCGSSLHHTFVDLGMSPLCESFLEPQQLNAMEPFFPLHVYLCEMCFLVQLEEYVSPESIFTEYAYFSSYADTWLQHAKAYTDLVTERFKIDASSNIVEIASNDGYLLQYFVQRGIPVLGIEPAANVARAAEEKDIPTLVKFFGEKLARKMAAAGKQADLLIGNNVLAQVPDLNGFVKGMSILLKPQGIITMEFPHLMRLMEGNQFDTIYHEHFSYFSLISTEKIFAAHGLTIFDVEELPTHGGSLRIYARHTQDSSQPVTDRVSELRSLELSGGFTSLEHYLSFAEKVKETKRKLLDFLIQAKEEGKTIAGYGAPGKGNTLLNYCGIRTDFLDYTVDRNPYKHGKYTPGTHIPIYPPDKIKETKPDYLLILPWNFKDEIMEQVSYIRNWGGQFIVPIPEVKVYSP